MHKDEAQKLFSNIRAYEWDEPKRRRNQVKHDIDFEDLQIVFEDPVVVKRSDRGTETRYIVLGFLEAIAVAVVCTLRGDRCRIISARRARTNERKELDRSLKRRSEEG